MAGRPLLELDRADFVWAALTGLASAVLFATTLTGHVYLGDGPETVAGISSLGILHDPGYPTYVLAAHVFTFLIPFGSEAFRVNLFSLVCASLAVSGVQLLARRCGAARWAGSVGALGLAASVGFWFYSGFAKHDLFSGLLWLLTLYLALSWRNKPTTARLIAVAAVVALGLGSSWPLEVTLAPTLAFILFQGRRGLSVRALASATASGLVVLIVIFGFVMVRAAQDPAVNWGDATTVSRLWQLVNRADFTPNGQPAGARAGSQASAPVSSRPQPHGAAPAHASATITMPAAATARIGNYAIIFDRELGLAGLLLAAFGLLASLMWRRGVASAPILIAFLVNLAAAGAVVSYGTSAGGYDSDLIAEGFVLGSYFALACWLAIGASEVVRVPGWLGARWGGRGALRPLVAATRTRAYVPVVAGALALAVLAPLVLDNRSVVGRSSKPFADSYARSLLGELPPRSAVFILGAELTQPLIYRQVVYHERPDVAVIAADGLEYGWYRQQLERRLGIRLPAPTGNPITDAADVMHTVARGRPVYLDPLAAQRLAQVVGYRPVGILSQLVPGRGQAPVSAPAALEQRVLVAERLAGFPDPSWNVWPNNYVAQAEYAVGALHVADGFYQHHDYAGMRSALLNALAVRPNDPIAERDLELLRQQGHGG